MYFLNSGTDKLLLAVMWDQIAVATYLSENLVVLSEELSLKSEAEKLQVLQRMPVIIMKSREVELFVNIQELAFAPDVFDPFIKLDKNYLLKTNNAVFSMLCLGGGTRS